MAEERETEVVMVIVVAGSGSGTIGGGSVGVAIPTDGSALVVLVDGLGVGGGNWVVTGMVDQPLVSVEAGTVVNGPVFQAFGSVESENVVIMLHGGWIGQMRHEVTVDT